MSYTVKYLDIEGTKKEVNINADRTFVSDGGGMTFTLDRVTVAYFRDVVECQKNE